MIKYKVRDFANKYGICYKTVWLWHKNKKFPDGVYSEITPSGSIFICDSRNKENQIIQNENNLVSIYCRVSSNTQKDDLERQKQRCIDYACTQGYSIENIFIEIASGLNDNRKQLNKILTNPPNKLIIEHKDRLTRFGFNYIDLFFKNQNKIIEVINLQKENKETELTNDLISVVTSFCARLYGARKGSAKKQKITSIINTKE